MKMAVASYRYRSRHTDEALRTKLVELAREKPRFGYRRLHVLLGRAGEHLNHKRVHRVGGRTDDSAEEAEAQPARGKAAAGADFGQPGVGAGFCARCGGV